MEAVNAPKKLIRSSKGQTLIELTLMVPIMLALVYGAVEIGSVISTYLTITHTTREGANLTSRGTDPNTALDAIITAAKPTLQNTNQTQWRVIYSKISQVPGSVCPPKPCSYRVQSQVLRGTFNKTSQIGQVSNTTPVTLNGIGDVDPGQIFHGIEVYYDYSPNVLTYIGKNLINKTFYERTIFTDVSGH